MKWLFFVVDDISSITRFRFGLLSCICRLRFVSIVAWRISKYCRKFTNPPLFFSKISPNKHLISCSFGLGDNALRTVCNCWAVITPVFLLSKYSNASLKSATSSFVKIEYAYKIENIFSVICIFYSPNNLQSKLFKFCLGVIKACDAPEGSSYFKGRNFRDVV